MGLCHWTTHPGAFASAIWQPPSVARERERLTCASWPGGAASLQRPSRTGRRRQWSSWWWAAANARRSTAWECSSRSCSGDGSLGERAPPSCSAGTRSRAKPASGAQGGGACEAECSDALRGQTWAVECERVPASASRRWSPRLWVERTRAQ
ncbi:hypothetical protein K491DRAFT_62114 [Lophiostoma macrostomum CBS 122681]|uniref:Uncharacterized protein n=1 Tax=Lophiostoma macrostomum CBS 122681 TaxID=1314788 RepID=A0A6A6TNQ2_9PLEO|nr:hypothetical protein K491DRAFT_62114 [Lophiostoma macrostomum CBS 122681]